jgi:predicted neuraminidase
MLRMNARVTFRWLFTLMICSSASFAQVDPSFAKVPASSLIFPPVRLHVHGSTIVGLPNGDMLVAWYQGSGERAADDVRIMGARLAKGSFTWTEPFPMADTRDIPDCNPVMFLNGGGKLFLVWIAVLGNHWESSILRYRTAGDLSGKGAPSWDWQDDILLKTDGRFADSAVARFRELPKSGSGWSAYAPAYDDQVIAASRDPQKRAVGWMTRIKPLILSSGRILLPLYSDGYNFSLVAVSDDAGESWRPSLPIVGRGDVQPALVLKKNGIIAAYMRDNGDEPGRVQYSESRDSGMNWTAATKTEMPNPGSSVEALVLKDGRWALVLNDTDDGRHRLSLFLSADEGKTWPVKKVLVEARVGKGGFSYPALIQTNDGLVRLTYSWHMEGEGESIGYITLDPKSLTP